MARGYGVANFGDGNYGVTTYVDAVASGSVSATVTVIGGEVFYGSSSISAFASGSASGVFVIDAAVQDITAVSATASAAVEVFDGIASMGGSAVGSSVAGTRVREAAALASSSASGSAELQFITNAAASTSMQSAMTAAGIRVALGHAEYSMQSEFLASGNITAVGYAAPSPVSSLTITYIRERSIGVNTVLAQSVVIPVAGREKWESFTPTSELWTQIPATSESWTPILA